MKTGTPGGFPGHAATSCDDSAATGASHIEPRRRVEDRNSAVMLINASSLSGEGQLATLVPLDTDVLSDTLPPDAQLGGASFLVSLDGDELLLLSSSCARSLPCDRDGEVLRSYVSALAASGRLERYRAARRMRMPDWLMVYVDELHAADSPDDVCNALIACAPLVIGAFTALVVTTDVGGETASLRAVQEPRTAVSLPSLPARAAAALYAPGIVSEVEVQPGRSGARVALAALFHAYSAAQLVCTPLTPGLTLVLVERRRDRVFTAEDRDLLDWIVKHARHRLTSLET